MTDPKDDELLQQSGPARKRFLAVHNELLQQLAAHGQEPEILMICCSDSRVVPEQLLGAKPGEIFMLRNLANLVAPYWQPDLTTTAVLEFAVGVLAIPHIVVCGHTDCGGIWLLDEDLDLGQYPATTRWLDSARPALREVERSHGLLPYPERHRLTVERNVVNQLENLLTFPYVRQTVEAGQLTLHGWVYYLEDQMLGFYDADAGEFLPE